MRSGSSGCQGGGRIRVGRVKGASSGRVPGGGWRSAGRMTLSDTLPTLAHSLHPAPDPRLWPGIDDRRLEWIAATFGTPTYVLDETEVRRQCRRFREVLGGFRVAFASKALSCKAVVRWVGEEGLWLDVCSAGELAVARAAGFSDERILFHGNAKTPEDVKAAHGAGRIVVDSVDELDRITDAKVLLRVLPGIAADTHPALATGDTGQKFGLGEGELRRALDVLGGRPDLELVGLHCHIGSQIRHVATYEQAARRMVGRPLVRLPGNRYRPISVPGSTLGRAVNAAGTCAEAWQRSSGGCLANLRDIGFDLRFFRNCRTPPAPCCP